MAEQRSAAGVVLRARGRVEEPGESPWCTAPATDLASRLLARYQQCGETFLDHVHGEFAVSLEDPVRDLRLAARDGHGNRYLSYRFEGGRLETAWEDADLVEPTGTGAELDPDRLASFYACDEVRGAETIFRDVRALLPGEMLILDRSGATGLRRRELPRPRLDLRIACSSWEEYVERFALLLERAVARALGGRSRAAILLSGGLDSSPIAAFAARSGCRLDAIFWQVADSRGEELAFALEAASAAGAALHPVPCDDAAPFADLERWPVHPSTPDQNAYREFHTRSYRRAAELGHDLVLWGYGGDMLYGNAKRWFWTLLGEQGIGKAIDRLREVVPRLGWWRAIRSQVLSPLLPRRRALRLDLPSYLSEPARERLSRRPPWPRTLPLARRPRQAERLLALHDAYGAHLERFYGRQLGLEIGSPLRDPDLVEFMLAVPDHLLQQGDETRAVLRAATSGLLPEPIRRRRGKASFHVALERGLAPENLGWAPELLRDPAALWRPYVRERAVERWLDGSFRDGRERLGFIQCLFAELWRYRRGGGDLAALARRKF